VTVATTERYPQEPTSAELEEAMVHIVATCRRYGQNAHRYGEWHEELNHLLDDWQTALLTEQRDVL
jgi:hypothetical protein